MGKITFVRKLFVHKVRNHTCGKSFEFQVYGIIIMSVQLAYNGGNVLIVNS